MTRIEQGDVWLYVYRTGLLSAVGHDLRLSVRRFRLEYGDGEIEARFWPAFSRVDVAVDEDGELDEGALSASDRRKIRGNIETEILETKAHPEVRFEGGYERRDGEAFDVAGELEMVGVKESIRTRVHRESSEYRTELELTPSDWGIEPYTAMLGSLQVEDRVRIVLQVEEASQEAAEA